MLPTLVLTDGAGAAATPGGIGAPSARGSLEPLGPAITWEDARAEAGGSAFREGFGGDALYRRTGTWIAEAIPPGLPETAPSTTARPLLPGAARTLGLVAGTPAVLGAAGAAARVRGQRPGRQRLTR